MKIVSKNICDVDKAHYTFLEHKSMPFHKIFAVKKFGMMNV